MALKGYTDADTVAAQLGRTLTDVQIGHLETVVLPAVEWWIDHNAGRAYGEGPVTAELLPITGPYVWLNKAPVTSLTAVRGWFYGQVSSDMFTIASTSYKLIDPYSGQLYFPDFRSYAHVEADYVPDALIPSGIKLAASMVAGVFMRTVLHAQTEWLTEFASAQDVRIKFRDIVIPDVVYTLIDSGSSGIVVA